MINTLRVVLASIPIMVLILSGCRAEGQVRSFETQDNLIAENPIGCVTGDATDRTHTPADVAVGMEKCVAAGNIDYAVELMMIASAYGRYDMTRVSDKSAHQALQALIFPITWELTESQKIEFQTKIEQLYAGSERHGQLCAHLSTQGPPKYFPKYMIAHGIKAFRGGDSGDSLVNDFDSAAGFAEALKFVHCEQTISR